MPNCPACKSQDTQAGFSDFNCLRCNAVFDYKDLKRLKAPRKLRLKKRTDMEARRS